MRQPNDRLVALLFNAALLASPFAGASLYETLTTTKLIDYTPQPGSLRSTRAALEKEASRFANGWDEPKAALNGLVAKELAEDDAAAARGFMLAAPAILRDREANKVQSHIPANATDQQKIAAALQMLEGPLRGYVERINGPGRGDGGDFAALGDPRELANDARNWLDGAPVDLTVFRLTGLAMAAEEGDGAQLGASVLRVAKNSARLSAVYLDGLEARLEEAVPLATLRSELAFTFQDPDAIVDEGAAVALAFSRARDVAGWEALREELNVIAQMARRVSPAGAAGLMAQADTKTDLERLALLAAAGGEMTVAIAKRNPDRLVLRSAKGAINWTPSLAGGLLAVTVLIVTMVSSVALALSMALKREWSAQTPQRAPQQEAPRTPTKADAVRRARNPS
jgi:hypothetical protein